MSHATCDPERDRATILQLAGAFEVGFRFEETLALVEGYRPRTEYVAAAQEVVIVLEQSQRHVVLQHILLLPRGDQPALPLKHWRQDWVFEDRDILEFRGDRVWHRRRLPVAEVACTWSQAVYQVDDGPRYESVGRFEYAEDGIATWTSRTTWRPLPRREHTKRSDYDVLVGVNQHRIASSGWTHEQDNRKYVQTDQRALVAELGHNTYRRISLKHESVAVDYMSRTSALWSDVRAVWDAALVGDVPLRVHDTVDGKRLYEHFFGSTDTLMRLADAERRERIRSLIARYVAPKAD